MFLNKLTLDQRKSFSALATKMALADGRVTVEEFALLDRLENLFGHKFNIPAEEIYGVTNTAPFDTRSSRVIALVGMLVVGYIDNSLHVDESTVLSETINAFGFSDQEVMRMKDWAKSKAQIFNELNAFIESV